jgi:rhodanese-related sulfurtransferase
MAAFTAENKLSGFSPSVTASELDTFIETTNSIFIDVRDVFAYEKSHVMGAMHIPLELLPEKLSSIPANRPVIVYDETGKKGHQALRTLIGAGFTDVTNVSGGHASLQRQARAVGFKNLKIELLEIEKKEIGGLESKKSENEKSSAENETKAEDFTLPIIVDVRTRGEFAGGAYPGAVNIELDQLQSRLNELGDKSRDITVYCASGARSAYAQRMLMQMGYTNVKNGGGLMHMMMRR